MITAYDLQNLRHVIAEWKYTGNTIAFVPTMGNLHDGHLALLAEAKQRADRTVVSIFVNPIQFGKGEDYESYPSTLDEDSDKLSALGLDLLFAPDLKQLYPSGTNQDSRVTVPDLSHILCGEYRPHHFTGVATVVCKLFINIQPQVALFGEKDYQQVLVIKRMVKDLCMPVEIVGIPIKREADGLAMSSRNSYLNGEERSRAPLIYKTLIKAAGQLKVSPERISDIESEGMATLKAAGFRPEYFSIRRSEDLGLPAPDDVHLSILAAAWLGSARLIDNVKVSL